MTRTSITAAILATLSLLSLGADKPARTVTVSNVKTDAQRVVYIIDHSGTMLDVFDFVRQEAIDSVSNLQQDQSFSVIMVSERTTAIYPKLQPATADQKKDLAKKLANFRAQGANDDQLAPFKEAFEKAFSLKPEVIYFLTDGHFDPRLAQELQRLNKSKAIKINLLAFIKPDPGVQLRLEEMAKENNGTYKFIEKPSK